MRKRMNSLDNVKLKLTPALAVTLSLWLQAVFCPLAAPAAPPGQASRRGQGLSSEARSHIRQAISSVGLILVRDNEDPADRGPRPRGSAVVVRKDGVIVTNFHVVARDRSTELYDEIYFALPRDGVITAAPAQLYRLKTVLINRSLDLALLRVANEDADNSARPSLVLPTIEMGDSRAVRELDELVIIGYPEKGGSTVTVNPGTIEGKDILENWIKTDARLIHGNSGGAAVDSEGKLIGIPTRVVVDRQPTDKDGDGFPDGSYIIGAVGFLRPSHVIAAMLAQIGDGEAHPRNGPAAAPQLAISGIVRSALDGKPIAGAAVGLVPVGTQEVSAKNILTWGYTDPDGRFQLNKLVPPGRYTLQAKTFGYQIFIREVELDRDTRQLMIELRRSEAGNQGPPSR
ncbi:MAG TPA: trypsin-like peptidase domain-containing protein [Blastocatellia bacterium]|jgi:S1-C subfamily serine protease|nr:trypsin-like peptidase domain-containing protein [Blastocatellia bacterium]